MSIVALKISEELGSALDRKVRQCFEFVGQQCLALERRARLGDQLARSTLRAGDAEKPWVGPFRQIDVTAGSLAESVGRRCDVEHVVGNLEGEADRVAVVAERRQLRRRRLRR